MVWEKHSKCRSSKLSVRLILHLCKSKCNQFDADLDFISIFNINNNTRIIFLRGITTFLVSNENYNMVPQIVLPVWFNHGKRPMVWQNLLPLFVLLLAIFMCHVIDQKVSVCLYFILRFKVDVEKSCPNIFNERLTEMCMLPVLLVQARMTQGFWLWFLHLYIFQGVR